MKRSEGDFKRRLLEDAELVNGWLRKYLPGESQEIINIVDAMNYSVMAGGKRLRPVIMYETFRLFGGEGIEIELFACALECIHTYSLVHDDLPAMDDDLLRRGLPTTHAKYGEATGILAGDALLTYAFELAARGAGLCHDAHAAAFAARTLASYAGYSGMIGGQILDLDAEERTDLTVDDVIRIFTLKTGRLLQAAFKIGAILAGRGEGAVLDDMDELGTSLGIAFQIQDDILDVTGDEASLGKPVGSDDKNSKTTSVTLLGIDGARALAEEYTKRAVSVIEKYERDDTFIKELILSLTDRRS